MVFLTRVLGYAEKLPRRSRRLIDRLRLHVTGGNGGSGLPRYGGLGGAGGNVYIVAEKGLTLAKVKKRLDNVKLKAQPGGDSSKKGIIGQPGEDLNIRVPLDISVYDDNRIKLGEINEENPKLLVARGGSGGNEYSGYCGLKGESRFVVLDFQLLADVGLIGFPNAGKSTFLNAITRARPRIANYPFTTVSPIIGTITYPDYRQITVADLPGLIEGAHANKGMGHKFLKHIQKTKLLLFILDIQGSQLSLKYDHRSCLETVLLLNKEIELYKPDLLEKPAMILVNKMDTKGANEIYEEIKPKLSNLSKFLSEFDSSFQPKRVLQFEEILTASLITKDANEIETIKETVRKIIDKYEEQQQFGADPDSNEDQLSKKLKRQMGQHAPTLV